MFRFAFSLLGPSRGRLGASWGGELDVSVRVPCLGPLLGPSCGPFGPSWAALGPSWGSLGPSWGPLGGLLGRLRAVLRASWAVLGAAKTRTGYMQQVYVSEGIGTIFPAWSFLMTPLGALGGARSQPPGLSGGHLGVSGSHVGHAEAIFGRLGPPWDHVEAIADRPRGILARMTPQAHFPGPPLQIRWTGLLGEGFGEGETFHTPMNPKGSVDFL